MCTCQLCRDDKHTCTKKAHKCTTRIDSKGSAVKLTGNNCPGIWIRVQSMSYRNLRYHTRSSVPQTKLSHIWEKLCCVSLHVHRIWNNRTILPKSFSLFFKCNSLSRVSFGWPVRVKDLYLQALDAGKSKQKYNSGTQPRSGSRGKSLRTRTAGPPLLHTGILFSL